MIVVFRKRAKGIFPWLIRMWTRSEYVHCEILVGDMLVSAIEGRGVRAIYSPGYLDPRLWVGVEVPTTTADTEKVHAWCEGEIGSGYDWLGILFCQVFHFGRQHKDKWFCSEFCTAALQSIGRLPDVKSYHQNPGSLYKLLTGDAK